jgi:hypothetical protein
MKAKYFVIALLLALLLFTVYKMMEYEKSIREERVITHYVEDETKPLIKNMPVEQLQKRADNIQYLFKTGATYFQKLHAEIEDGKNKTHWEDFFLKGVNLGVAVPGKFPAEFSLSFEEYLSWFKMIGEMNANVIRTYTILPPGFYKAFAFYNLNHQNKPLFLMQGVWARIPQDKDYFNIEYSRGFQKEIIDVIDVVHGKAVLKPQAGKASGTYVTDISHYVVAILLGREWEPEMVHHTNLKNQNDRFDGSFVSINNANAMEAWLAKMMDFAVLYETQVYQWQHPISIVNWLPLDPMFHNTEFIENDQVREYDNDLHAIDFRKFNASKSFHAGIYAAYHAYPYYPDYVYLQKDYANTINHQGEKDNYFGYLEDLKKHCEGMPLVIAEYGLPSSRGVSHFTPSGFNQGGLSEAKQAELSKTLTEDIYETQCAGAIYFEWADEWFKHNWLVMDFETPFHDRKLWHNMENPEQNFGILALENKKKNIDALLTDWDKDDQKYEIKLSADADPTYFYLSCQLADFDFKENNLYIAIDTYDDKKGDHKLKFTDKTFDEGFEFLCEFQSKEKAKILVDEPYSVFTDIYNDHTPVYASSYNNNGEFIDQLMLVNRSRETLLGEKTDSIINNRSPLVFGNSNEAKFSNADWYWSDTGKVFELRLDWHLLNVSDPAKRIVLDDKPNTKVIEYSKTDGFNIYLFVTDKNEKLIAQYPQSGPFFFSWDEWEMPSYTQRLKPIYDTLKNYFHRLKPKSDKNFLIKKQTRSFSITDFFDDKKAAVSISFDNAAYSQFELALPILKKYNIKATFGIIPDVFEDVSGSYDIDEGTKLKRMGLDEIKAILNDNNEIALQSESNQIRHQQLMLPDINAPVQVVHTHQKNIPEKIHEQILFVRKSTRKESLQDSYDNITYCAVNSNIQQRPLDSLLQANQGLWTIMLYHNLYRDSTELNKITKNKVDDYFIKYDQFKKQIRLIRNTNYWVASESAVFKYLREKQGTKIDVKQFDDFIFVKATNKLNPYVFNQPLTIRFETDARIIKVTGSASDGIFTNRTGSIIFNVYPNKEIKLELIRD